VPDGVGRLEIDRVHFQQSEVALPIPRRSDLAVHGVAGAQAESADLAGADINVVGAGEVVRFRTAQEAEAVGQDFQRAVALDRLIVVGEIFEDREHDILLAQRRCVLDLEGFSEIHQFGWCFLF
jgi:hypothetical protein